MRAPAAPAVRGVEALLRPRSIAVIGASASRRGSGNFILGNVLASPAPTQVHVVHPSAEQIDGVPAVRSIAELPEGLDAALVSLPARSVMPVLEQLQARGCAAALVPAAGFNAWEQQELSRFARTSAMALHGPNCMGIINVSDQLPLWFYEDQLTAQRPGSIALVSQSGSAMFLTRATESVGFSKIVSTGDEIGLTTADYLRWLADDPQTAAIGVVLESIKDVRDFTDAVRCLREAGKPMVALKVGRTVLGSVATRAHTGALTGKDAAYAALFERLDVPLLADYDELASVLECLTVQQLPASAGVRIAVLTDSGGEAGLAADLSARQNVVLPAFAAATEHALQAAAPGTQVHNPLDIGASPAAGDDIYRTAYGLAVSDPNVDALMVILEAHHGLTRGERDYSIDLCAALRELAASDCGKPIVAVSSSSTATSGQIRDWLGEGVPLLRGIGNGFAALRALASNRKAIPTDPIRPQRLPEPGQVARMRSRLLANEPTIDRELLARYGLPLAESLIARTESEAVDWATGRYPVVVKIASPDIAHRSELGAVVTGVGDQAALMAAIERIRMNVATAVPSASIEGYEIQEHIPAGVEAVLGFAADPVFGATVSVGSGGTLVELEADVSTALVPVSAAQASDLISRTRLGTRLAGYRNLVEVTDLASLAEAVESLSWLAADFGDLLAECDLNPAIVQPGSGRMSVVDFLLVRNAGGRS